MIVSPEPILRRKYFKLRTSSSKPAKQEILSCENSPPLPPQFLLPYQKIIEKRNSQYHSLRTTQFSTAWTEYLKDLTQIAGKEIPRCISIKNSIHFQLHGFSEASEKAYAGKVYLRPVSSTGHINVALIAAKDKVAPVHQISLPRLELLGALLLAELQAFSADIHCLQDNAPLPKGSRLKTLCPFVDNSGALRVGGRLAKSELDFNNKHPLLLPRNPVTELIIEAHQVKLQHAGLQALRYAIQEKYWTLPGKKLFQKEWKLGNVIKVHGDPSDPKKLIRTVTVKTAKGELVRPITKLAPLINAE
ncbi:unnamed protein product [Allacma fusca]|uniref:DUF5641 domain-containing protein n=1 Tax=Allacma fusca TaxID=39272 RepID=A0A8J2K338_9HEXA|nr:unnamed protein product [Allacma fusca]